MYLGSCRGSGRGEGRRADVQVTILRKGRHGNQSLCPFASSVPLLPLHPSPSITLHLCPFPPLSFSLSSSHIFPSVRRPSHHPIGNYGPFPQPPVLSPSLCSPLPVPPSPPPPPRSSWLPTVITQPSSASSCRFCHDRITRSTTLLLLPRAA